MARRQHRTFSAEFKYDTTSSVLDQGYNFAEACRAIDVLENTLCNWKRLHQFNDGLPPAKAEKLTKAVSGLC